MGRGEGEGKRGEGRRGGGRRRGGGEEGGGEEEEGGGEEEGRREEGRRAERIRADMRTASRTQLLSLHDEPVTQVRQVPSMPTALTPRIHSFHRLLTNNKSIKG